MNFKLLNVAGINEALYGLGLSFGKTKGENLGTAYSIMLKRADSNAHLGLGHNKYLESIMAWIEVTGSRAFWSEMDTYRLMTKQSDSTMHTLFKDCQDREEILDMLLSSIPERFENDFGQSIKDYFNTFLDLIQHIKKYSDDEVLNINIAKMLLPEGWQQTRVLCVSYKTLQNIYAQRKNHRLYEWQQFCAELKQLPHSEWITGGK